MANYIKKMTRAHRLTARALFVVATSMAALGFHSSAQAGAMFNAQAEALAEITAVTLPTGQVLTEGDVFDAISTDGTTLGNLNVTETGAGNSATASFDGSDGAGLRVFEVSANASGTTIVPGSVSASADATVTVVITNTTAGAVTVDLLFANGIGSTLSFNLDSASDSSGPISASTDCVVGGASPCTTSILVPAQVGPIGIAAFAPQPTNALSQPIGTSPNTFTFTMTAAASGSVATAPPAQIPEPGVLALMALGLLWAGGRVYRQST